MIEELPNVPFRLILSKLSFEDRLCLRRTCKKLKALVDCQVCRNRLFIFLDFYPCHETLFHTHEPVYYTDSCRVPDFDRFISSSYKEKLRQLKKLTIFFEGSCMLVDYEGKIELDPENLDKDYFFYEVSHLQIDLEDLNFFEKIEHLEIKGIGRVFGHLRLKNLKIFSVQPRGPSQFDLDCPALRAMCISYGARPNFIGHSHLLDCLSIKRLLPKGTFDYLVKLYGQCQGLSTIGFEYLKFLRFSLNEVNAGHINLPQWRVIRFESPQYLEGLCNRLADSLIEYEKKIEPERLRIIYNEKLITLEQLLSIIQIHEKFRKYRNWLSNDYLKFLRDHEPLASLSCLYSSITGLAVNREDISLEDELDEDTVSKLKNIPEFMILPGPCRISKMLFRTMFTTWTKLERLQLDHLPKQVDQYMLDQMPGHLPNLTSLVIGERPEDLKFMTAFKNLKKLYLNFQLSREEIMFLIRNSLSLYLLALRNPLTEFYTSLAAENSKHPNYYDPLRTASGAYEFDHYRVKDRQVFESRSRLFSSLKRMIDYYFDYDFYNQRNVSEFTKIKILFKKML